jgi:hypothetical protein
MRIMKFIPRSLLAAGGAALAFGAGFAVAPDRAQAQLTAAGGRQYVAPSEISALQNKIADLEKRLAALTQQFAGHTHNYMPPRCNSFVNFATFRNVLNNPGMESSMGICLVSNSPPAPGGIPTSAPNR